MKRAEKVLHKAKKLVENSERPTAKKLCSELQMTEEDVHRCLNYLERRGDVETHSREVLESKNRLISVHR